MSLNMILIFKQSHARTGTPKGTKVQSYKALELDLECLLYLFRQHSNQIVVVKYYHLGCHDLLST